MRKGVRAYHDHVDRLNEEARVQLDESIDGRLRRRRGAPGPPQGHWKLAQEIAALLENPRLSHDQAKELEDTYFRRPST